MAAEEASSAPAQASSVPPTADPPGAWQPFTPRGVAGFALASVSRLLLIQLAVALLVAGSAGWFCAAFYFPRVSAAIEELPAEGEIRGAELRLPDQKPRLLAEHRLLGIAVDADHSGAVRPPSHVLVEFGKRDLQFTSLFGKVSIPYEKGVVIAFNQPELGPWWGAWAPPILAILVLLAIVSLFVSWSLLSLLYSGPACLLALVANRDCGFGKAWKLSGASLMPGALLLAVGIVLYGLGAIDLVQLLALWALHFVVGWLFVLSAICYLPKVTAHPAQRNPFK